MTKVRLNYEDRADYNVSVTVVDKGNASLTQEIVVRVLDMNDPPSGILLSSGASVAENSKVRRQLVLLSTIN